MEHDLELIIARLEILEIEVCNILQNPENIGKWIFLIQSYPGNIGNLIFPFFPYPGNIGNMIFLDLENLDLSFFLFFLHHRKFLYPCIRPISNLISLPVDASE